MAGSRVLELLNNQLFLAIVGVFIQLEEVAVVERRQVVYVDLTSLKKMSKR